MSINLDIGCGTLKHEGCIGVDIKKSDGVDIVADATNLPFTDSSVDYVYSRECIAHVGSSDIKALSEMYRVLKVGGQVEIITSSFLGWFTWRIRISSHRYSMFRLYTDYSFKRKLRKAGFHNFKITHIFLPNRYLLIRKLGLKIRYHDIKAVCYK